MARYSKSGQSNYNKPDQEKKPYYEEITERLIKQLEEGTAPWQKPWEPDMSRTPHNPTTGNNYKGANSLWLRMQNREDPRWMTYKQAQGIGAQVNKGERGTSIQYWKFDEEKAKRDANGKIVKDSEGNTVKERVKIDPPRAFTATVFNGEQISGLPPLEKKEQTWNRHERAETILKNSGVPLHNDQADMAYYTPVRDEIHMPKQAQFDNADKYYATALHELGHATGHKSRLDRDLSGNFGSESYAKEELRAEIGSMIIGEELEIGHDPGQHAAYVKSWIKVLKDDPTEIMRAAKDAEAIKNLVLSYEKEKQTSRHENLETDKTEKTAETPQDIAVHLAKKFAAKGQMSEEDQQRFLQKVQERLQSGENTAGNIKLKEQVKTAEKDTEAEYE